MRILMLGGTAFVGRAIVDSALARGWDVTLFGRGRTGAELFPQAERRHGDRSTGDYTSLTGQTWNAVVDISGYVPRHVTQAVDALGDRVGRYLFISTGSVYDPARAVPGSDEDSPRVAAIRDTEDVTADSYGPLKVGCEDEITSRYAERATIVRPGIVAGPHDPTDRFIWWVRRAARGGRLALPGRPGQPVQVVDSRDLAALVTALLADNRAGVFNAVGPAEPTTLGELAQACANAAGTSIDVVPMDPQRVGTRLPLVLPDATADPTFQRSAVRARAVGLPATPLATTAADVATWDRDRGQPPLVVGMSPAQEAELLATAGKRPGTGSATLGRSA